MWLGLRRSKWMLGKKELKKNYWGLGEPSDTGTCLTVSREQNNFVWKSEQCSSRFTFFCKVRKGNLVPIGFTKEPTPKPTKSGNIIKSSTTTKPNKNHVNDKKNDSSGSSGKDLTIGLVVLCLILLFVFIVIIVLFIAYRRRSNQARKKSRENGFAVARRCQDPAKMFTTVMANEEPSKSIPDVVPTQSRANDLYAKFKQQMKELTPRYDEDQTPFTSLEVAPDVRDEPTARVKKVSTEHESRSKRHHHRHSHHSNHDGHRHHHKHHRHKRDEFKNDKENVKENESSDHKRHRHRRRRKRREETEEPVRRSRSLSSRRKNPDDGEIKPKIRTRSNSWVGNMAPPVPPRDNLAPKVYDDVVTLEGNTKSDIEI